MSRLAITLFGLAALLAAAPGGAQPRHDRCAGLKK